MQNKQAIILLFIANSISGFAQGITMIAIPWYFINIIEKPIVFGWIYFFITIGSLVWGTYAGTLIDKYNRKTLFLIQTLVGGSILSIAALFSYVNGSTPIALAALVFMVTIFVYNIHYPNLYAFAQEITAPENYGKINSYIEIQGQVTTMLAGAIASVLISQDFGNQIAVFDRTFTLPFAIKTWPLHKIFALDACTYFLALITIWLIKYQPLAKRYKETGNALAQLKTGLNYLKQHTSIFIFGVASYAVFVTILIGTHYLLPGYISQILKADVSVYAISEFFFALGAILAGIAITKIFSKTNAIMAVIIMTVFVACVYLTINLKPVVWLFYAGFLLVGLCNAGTRIMRVTYLFQNIPNQLIGRTTSVFRVGAVLFRLVFVALFTLPLFANNLKLPYYLFIIFLLACAFVIARQYKHLIKY